MGALVSLAANNVVSIAGGNRQLFGGFARASGAEILLRTEVTKLRRLGGKDEKYELSYCSVATNETTTDIFDAVIIAAPFHQTNIVTSPSNLNSAIPPQPYVRLHVTFVATNASSPASKLFNRKFGDPAVPRTVYSTFVERSEPKPRFNSMAYLRNVRSREGVAGDVHIIKRRSSRCPLKEVVVLNFARRSLFRTTALAIVPRFALRWRFESSLDQGRHLGGLPLPLAHPLSILVLPRS